MKDPIPWNGQCAVHVRTDDIGDHYRSDDGNLRLVHQRSSDIWLAEVRGCIATAIREASEPLWREGRHARWTRPEPLGVIAGSLPIGLGRLFGALPGANDGVVRVDETEVQGMRSGIVLPVAHSAMPVSARVAALVDAFLRDARFLPRA